MSKVYVTNFSPSNDYTDIEAFGTSVFVTEGIVRMSGEKLHSHFRSAFTQATDADYILLVGPPLLTAIAYAEWTKRFSKPSVFCWNRRSEKYELQHITISESGT